MIKSIYQVYLLLVCFFAMIVITFSVGTALNNCAILAAPKYLKYYTLARYESDETYLQSLKDPEDKAPLQIPPSELTEKRMNAQKAELQSIKNWAIGDILREIIWLFVAVVLFAIHWRLFQKEKEHTN